MSPNDSVSANGYGDISYVGRERSGRRKPGGGGVLTPAAAATLLLCAVQAVVAQEAEMKKVASAVIHSWHCDAMGHLNTRFYVGIFDDANYVLITNLAARAREVAGNLWWVDVRNEVDFLAETRAGTVVHVFAAIRRIGTKSVTIAAEMRPADSDAPCARMVAVMARFDLSGRHAVPLSASMLAAAREWLEPGNPLLGETPGQAEPSSSTVAGGPKLAV
jgi:acyl-CoA thioester hydrolase